MKQLGRNPMFFRSIKIQHHRHYNCSVTALQNIFNRINLRIIKYNTGTFQHTFASCSQFHQHFMSSFCSDSVLPKQLQSQSIIKEMLRKSTFIQNKACVKCWWNLHLWSILTTFYEQLIFAQNQKKYWQLSWIFMLLWTLRVKAVHKSCA